MQNLSDMNMVHFPPLSTYYEYTGPPKLAAVQLGAVLQGLGQ